MNFSKKDAGDGVWVDLYGQMKGLLPVRSITTIMTDDKYSEKFKLVQA